MQAKELLQAGTGHFRESDFESLHTFRRRGGTLYTVPRKRPKV